MSTTDVRARARVTLDALTAAVDAPTRLSASVDDSLSSAASIFIPDEAHERRVQATVDIERAKREARRRLDAEERGHIVPPTFDTLRDRLARPRPATVFRITDWQPCGSRVMLTAQGKTGKTILVGNVMRSLADGDAFLGRYAVAPVDGTIALVDFEMSGAQLDAWLRAQGIHQDHRVFVIPLRGQAASFNILDSQVRADWVARFRQHQVRYLLLDCLRPILDALGLDEHHDVGRFLVALDALLLDAGIRECLVVHHMGHGAERARGDSRLRDWPDVEWRLLRQDDDPATPRYITAYGRDVDVPESRLVYEPATRALTITAGSRKDAVAGTALDAVFAALGPSPKPLSGLALKKALIDDFSKHVVDNALRLGVQTKALTVEEGPRNSKLYSLPGSVPVSLSLPSASGDSELLLSASVPPPFREGTLRHSHTGEREQPTDVRDTHSSSPSRPHLHLEKARSRPGKSRLRAKEPAV
jgi:hypothetical protein